MPRNVLDDLKARQANAELARRLRSIQGMAAAIKCQLRLFESTSRENPAGHSAIFVDMARRVEELRAEAIGAKNALPANAPDNLKANVRGTYRAIARELEKVYADLRKAFERVDETFKDPARVQTPFGSDPISMIGQVAQMLTVFVEWKRRKSE